MTRPPGSHPGPRPAHALLVSLPPFRFAALFPVCACVVVSRTDGLCSGLSCCHAMQQRHRAQGSPGLRPLKPTTVSPEAPLVTVTRVLGCCVGGGLGWARSKRASCSRRPPVTACCRTAPIGCRLPSSFVRTQNLHKNRLPLARRLSRFAARPKCFYQIFIHRTSSMLWIY